MKTRIKIENKGYSITSNIGYRNDEQCIVSYTAKKGNISINRPSLTQLLKAI